MKKNRVSIFQVFLLIIITGTMYNNLEHSASVYYRISYNPSYAAWYNHLQSYLVVIVIDLSVIAFILAAKERESVIFAWVLFVINCLFFNVIGSLRQVLNPTVDGVNDLLAKLIFSGVFSYSLHRFSSLWSHNQTDYAQIISSIKFESDQKLIALNQELTLTQAKLIETDHRLTEAQAQVIEADRKLIEAQVKVSAGDKRVSEAELELTMARQKLSRSKKPELVDHLNGNGKP